MDIPVIEHGDPLPKDRARKPLFDFVLTHLPELGPEENIFFEERDKSKQRTLYFALKRLADRRDLPMVIKFYDDGLRVWKLAK